MNDIITMFKVNHDSLDFAFIWNFCGYKILSADDCRYLFNQQISYSFLMNSTKDEIKYRMKDYSLFKNVTDGLNRTRKIDYLQFEDLSISFLLNFSEISQILQKFKNNGINKLALLLNQEGILQDFDFISGEEKVDLYGALNSSLAYLEKTPFDKLWNANIDDSEIINDKILFNALKDKLIVIIKKHKNPIPLFKLKTFMGIPTNRQLIFNKLTAKALTEKQIEFCSNGVKLHELSLKEFIASIKNKIRSTVFNLRLNGVSVKEIADKLEMTEGFVQNIEKQVLSMKSPLIEDKYAYFYETYKLSRSEFMQIFSESNLTYNYLEIAYVSGEKSISHLRNDSLITENQRDIVRAMVSEGFIVVNGERVRVSSEEIKKFLVETYATEEITFKEFINLHDEFLTIYDLKEGYDIFPMDLEDVREFVNSSNYILGSLNGKFRYFDIESINYKQFLEDINIHKFEGIELSTMKFINDYDAVMQEYRIMNEYELHSLLKKLNEKYDLPVLINARKSPTIQVGRTNFENQIVSLIKTVAPIEIREFAKIVETEFGIKTSSFLASSKSSSIIEPYLYGNLLQNIEIKPLSPFDTRKLEERLTKRFYLITDLEKIFNECFPFYTRYPNKQNLDELGFALFGSYAVKLEGESIEEYFRNTIQRERNFNLDDFKEFMDLSQFKTVFNQMQKSLEIVEFSPKAFVNLYQLEAGGVTLKKLKKFQDDVSDLVEDGEIFTLDSLLQLKGLDCPFEPFGFGSFFAASIISNDDRFKYRRVSNNLLLVKGKHPVTIYDLISQLLGSIRKIDIYDLSDKLAEDFALEISVDQIKAVVKKKEVHYDDVSENIYATYTDYFEEF